MKFKDVKPEKFYPRMIKPGLTVFSRMYCYAPYGIKDPRGEFVQNPPDRVPDHPRVDPLVSDVTIAEITEKLKVSRDYVSKKIAPYLELSQQYLTSSATGKTVVFYNGRKFRKWLMDHAEFTRQTRRIHVSQLAASYAASEQELLGRIPVPMPDGRRKERIVAKPQDMPYISERHRQEISTIHVRPFDFFDCNLFFPKEYYRTPAQKEGGQPQTSEICYRDMFLAGAIKIQLGKQKTMFYIPEIDELPPIDELRKIKIDDTQLPLVPAAWLPKVGYVVAEREQSPEQEQREKDEEERRWRREVELEKKQHYRLRFTIDTERPYSDIPKRIETALQKGFRIIGKHQYPLRDEGENKVDIEYSVVLPATGEEILQIKKEDLQQNPEKYQKRSEDLNG